MRTLRVNVSIALMLILVVALASPAYGRSGGGNRSQGEPGRDDSTGLTKEQAKKLAELKELTKRIEAIGKVVLLFDGSMRESKDDAARAWFAGAIKAYQEVASQLMDKIVEKAEDLQADMNKDLKGASEWLGEKLVKALFHVGNLRAGAEHQSFGISSLGAAK